MRLLLIPVADALPAIDAYFARWPEDNGHPTSEEVQQLTEISLRFVEVANALVTYIKALSGRPSRN